MMRGFGHTLLILCMMCAWGGCMAPPADRQETDRIKACIRRYNLLLADGYRALDMTPLQEVASQEQATKLYYHMAALSEGKVKMDSTLKNPEFIRINITKPDEASVATRETWDFAHVDMRTGKKLAEERDFIYEMDYLLKRREGRWVITGVTTVSGASTTTTIPWPVIDRQGKRTYPAGQSPVNSSPAGHP